VSVVCCQVEVSATGWSLVQRSPTECGVSNWVWSWSVEKWGGLSPQGAVEPLEGGKCLEVLSIITKSLRVVDVLFDIVYCKLPNMSDALGFDLTCSVYWVLFCRLLWTRQELEKKQLWSVVKYWLSYLFMFYYFGGPGWHTRYSD
jgi:hypothetical protein